MFTELIESICSPLIISAVSQMLELVSLETTSLVNAFNLLSIIETASVDHPDLYTILVVPLCNQIAT